MTEGVLTYTGDSVTLETILTVTLKSTRYIHTFPIVQVTGVDKGICDTLVNICQKQM